MKSPFKSLETKLIHAGEPEPRILGAVAMPIFQSATFQYAGETSYHDLKYIRLNNTPNHVALHQKLAAVENAEAALVTASGMAAISTSLLTVLKAGDHLLIQSSLYGGTHDLVTRDFPAFGLSYDFIEAERPETWKALLKPNTKAIYVEAMTNPLSQVADLEAIVQFARTNGLVSLIDSTFASPVNFRALEWGFDLSLHSGTKYSTDIRTRLRSWLGQAAWIRKITHRLNHLGGTLDPHAAYLLHRGLKTMALRVRCQNESALKIARFLAAHSAVARVNYAGLETHPGHDRARRLFTGFGGVLSFEPRAWKAADKFLSAVRFTIIAISLRWDSLATRPPSRHAGLAPKSDAEGIADGLIRLSIGISNRRP